MVKDEDIDYLICFANKDEILEEICTIAFDYDGFESSEDLKGLIDELVMLAKHGLSLEE